MLSSVSSVMPSPSSGHGAAIVAGFRLKIEVMSRRHVAARVYYVLKAHAWWQQREMSIEISIHLPNASDNEMHTTEVVDRRPAEWGVFLAGPVPTVAPKMSPQAR